MKIKWDVSRYGILSKILLGGNNWLFKLVKLPENQEVTPRSEPHKGYKNYRVDFYFCFPKIGGVPIYSNTLFQIDDRFVIFRPDIETFSVSKVLEGNGYMLSLDIFIKDTSVPFNDNDYSFA